MPLTKVEPYMLATLKITTVAYTGSATAVNPAGSETVTVTGSGFNSGVTVYIDTTSCSITYVSATSLTFTTPAKTAGGYQLYVYNTDGTYAMKPGGIIFNQPPVWVTSAGALLESTRDAPYATVVVATGTGITYSITSGSLPTGLSLNSSTGDITGTPTLAQTANFTVTAVNSYNQTTSRAFSIQVSPVVAVTYLAVAGGGSGGTGYYGGGGGAGGVLTDTSTLAFGVTYTITIGSGGVGTTVQTNRGGNGGNSSITGSGFTSIISIGGGGGGSRNADTNGPNAQGAPGGSGGGASFTNNVGGKGVYPGSSYLDQARQGYDGGSTANDSTFSAGGGGAGAAGTGAAGTPNPRAGGVGLASSITGTSVTYGGGGGNAYGTSFPGDGGGGAANIPGTANTGGGGGGGIGNNAQGGTGGSGVIIIKYPDSVAAATTTGSPTVTSVTGFRIYKFTGTGTFTLNT